MIDPTPNQAPFIDNSTENWFDSIQTPTPEPPGKSRKKLFIIGGLLLVLFAAGLVAALFMNQSSPCLDKNDYKTLTSNDAEDSISPTGDFYTEYALFKTSTNEYDNSSDSGEHGEKLIQKIADFYKTVSKKSVVITIRGNYFVTDAKDRAEQHLNTVKSDLINAGVSEKVISTDAVTYIEPEEPGDVDSETIIAITSATTCK